MTPLERAQSAERVQSAELWLESSLLSVFALYAALSFFEAGAFGMLYLCFVGIIAHYSHTFITSISFWGYYALLALIPFLVGILLPVICVFASGVIWRRSLKHISLDFPEGMIFDRSHVIEPKQVSHHLRLQATAHLHHLPSFIQSAVVRHGYLYYLR